MAYSLDDKRWRRITWAEGSNDVLSSTIACVRVRVAPKNHRSKPLQEEQWAVIEWPDGAKQPTKYWLSNLPASTAKKRLVTSAKIRWRIERDYQELKQELGLNQYEGRNWRGFHQHASLCIAAYGFLVIQRLAYPGRERIRVNVKNLPYPTRTDPEEPRRMQRHVCDSIATLRWQLAQAIARTIVRCRVVAGIGHKLSNTAVLVSYHVRFPRIRTQ